MIKCTQSGHLIGSLLWTVCECVELGASSGIAGRLAMSLICCFGRCLDLGSFSGKEEVPRR
jgi:hypothetical protein